MLFLLVIVYAQTQKHTRTHTLHTFLRTPLSKIYAPKPGSSIHCESSRDELYIVCRARKTWWLAHCAHVLCSARGMLYVPLAYIYIYAHPERGVWVYFSCVCVCVLYPYRYNANMSYYTTRRTMRLDFFLFVQRWNWWKLMVDDMAIHVQIENCASRGG